MPPMLAQLTSWQTSKREKGQTAF